MASNLRLRPLRLFADRMEDNDEGMEAGTRLGAPPPEWDEGDVAGESDDSENGSHSAAERGQRLVRGGFVVLLLAGFCGVLWYAYQWGLGDSEVVELPVVAAEAGPDKVKPADPGGLQVPYQDQLVLNQDSATGEPVRVERLLPPPEVPLPPPAPESAATAEAGAEAALLVLPAEATPDESTTLAIGTAAGSTEPETAPAGGETTPSTEVSTAPAPPKPAAESETAAGDAQATQPAATAAAGTTQVAAAGDFALQLASLKSSDAAEREWARLRGAYPKLMGGLSLIVQPADIQGVGKVYRLQVGSFPNRTTAAGVCAQLKTKQQDCFVVRQ